MPSRKIKFTNNEIYHVVIRSVGDTPIFIDENDYFRGIFSIYEFNNSQNITIWLRRIQRKKEKVIEKSIKNRSIEVPDTSMDLRVRSELVEVLTFAFMPNHIHLLVKQINNDGIVNFAKKISGGYANYFNKKYSRKGHLFCTFKAVHIETDEQLGNVFAYIHCNPISLIEPGWKENGIKNPDEVIKFLNDKYRWSGYMDYIGIVNFPSVTQRNFISEIMGKVEGCRNAVEKWIKHKSKINNFDEIDLE